MKKVILLVLFMPVLAYGQIVENFESSGIENWVQSSQGHWKADTTFSLSGEFSLHHVFDNPESGTDKVGLALKNLSPSMGSVKWTFQIRHGYDPSSSNNWAVFLMSDADPAFMSPDDNTQGYAIGVNLSGTDDTLRLLKVKGNILTEIINCKVNWQTQIGTDQYVKIITERSQSGTWKVTVYNLAGDLISTAEGFDNELFPCTWFGIYYKYSSTRDRLIWFDDLEIDGTFYEDTIAPSVTGYTVTSSNSLDITLSEEPTYQFLNINNFKLNEEQSNPIAVQKKNTLLYSIIFEEEFLNKSTNELIISSICDTSGNCLRRF